MELIEYIRLLRRWFWVIIVAAFIAGGAMFLFRSRQTDVYQAQVTISVGTFIEAPNPNSAEITTGVELAQTYVHLAKTYAVLEAAIEAGDFPLTTKQLDNAVSVSAITDTSLLKIVVSHTDPALAVWIADEVAQQLILNSPSNLTPQQQAQIDLTTAEIERLELQLEQERLRLATIQEQMAVATDPLELEHLNEQYNTVIGNINYSSSTIAQFSDTLSSLQQRTNSLDIVDPARILDENPGQSSLMTTILGAIVGAALAFGGVLLIEYLDNTIRTMGQATEVLALPGLAAIPRFGKRRTNDYEEQLITYLEPQSPVVEEFRALRTNLMYTANGSTAHRAYIITSAGPAEGKTITTANMAVTMAMAGWRVILIDTDLRRPRIHELFGLENQVGLTTLLATAPQNLASSDIQRLLQDCVSETNVPGLSVITSGHVPINPTEVLGSQSLQEWYKTLLNETRADIVLFDTPPVLAVADAPVLASSLNLAVVLVVRAARTRPGSLLRAKERLTALDIDIKGFVLNALNPRDQGDEYDHSYYYYYYRDRKSPNPVRTPEVPRHE